MKKIDLNNLPTKPGCYIYRDINKKIIYIGKAKNIKKRVLSYFSKKEHDPKTQALLKNIHSVDSIVTKNEVEALILENNLIKKNRPRYNIDLKDSKSYAFIEQTNEVFPRLTVSRQPKKKDKILFGPFTSAKARDDILQIINKTFKLRTCKKLPKRACLRHSIGICAAPCIKMISEEDYKINLIFAKEVLKGKIKETIEKQEKKMKEASKNLEFERAKEYRDQISSLEYLSEKQNVERKRQFNEDIINYSIKNNKVYLLIFNVYKGTLNNKQEFSFDYSPDFLEEFLVQHYSETEIPKEIIMPERVDSSIEEYLSKRKKQNVKVVVPKQGEKKELLNLVKENIEITFFGKIERLETLKKVLDIKDAIYVIECFDISHLSGTNIVASMVQFRGGIPDKSNYRRFKLRTVKQNDDFLSMREVVRRRYKRLKENKEDFPDLIVVDGGKGQLNSAIKVLDELGIKIPIIGLAKEFEEIYLPNTKEPIRLSEKNKARLLLEEIRDEAHRFAIKYNRLLRKREIRKK